MFAIWMVENNLYKSDFYSYTGSNRMKSSVIEDHREKTKTITRYDYALHLFRSRRRETKRIISDSCSLLSRPRERAVALGSRTLVQDEGSTLMRTLYDGMSFDIIREQESFADGYFTNTSDTNVDWQASGEESASRYRYIGEEADSNGGNPRNGENQANSQSLIPSNFHANSNADYRLVSPNRSRSSVTLFAKGEAVATNKNSYSTSTTSSSTGNRSGTTSASTKRSYFGTDMIGSVRSATHDDGLNANYYDYDVFGKPFGETNDYGYVGKPYDPVTGLSNYGYRDYSPKTARFTTVDPIRDGHNWYAYCSNDPVNFVDLWGLVMVHCLDSGAPTVSFTWPLKEGRITTVYGPTTPADTNQGKSNPLHQGIDVAPVMPGQTGQDIFASAKGVVVSVETNNKNGYGTTITIEHLNGYVSRYSHLESTTVETGDEVTPNTIIGTLGNTGKSGGAHLDFRVTDWNGNYVDPLALLQERPSSITVEEKYITINKDCSLCNK